VNTYPPSRAELLYGKLSEEIGEARRMGLAEVAARLKRARACLGSSDPPAYVIAVERTAGLANVCWGLEPAA
jgi:hypothetical protein